MAKNKQLVFPEGLGNASPLNVEKGVTFSSDNGLLLEGIREKGNVFEHTIPAGTVLNDAKEDYCNLICHNIVNVDSSVSGDSNCESADIMAETKSVISQYNKSAGNVSTSSQKVSVETNIVIADIREFILKVGNYSFDISFAKTFFNLTIKGSLLLKDKFRNHVFLYEEQVGTFIYFDIQKGIIKKIGFVVFGGSSTSGIKTKYDISIKVNTVVRSIIDADALPADVAKGKVFYNNDGKNIGTGEKIEIKTLEVNVDRTSEVTTTYEYYVDYIWFEDNYVDIESWSNGGTHIVYRKEIKINFDVILYIEVNGEKKHFACSSDTRNAVIGIRRQRSTSSYLYDDYAVCFVNKNTMYINFHNDSSYESLNIKVHYI